MAMGGGAGGTTEGGPGGGVGSDEILLLGGGTMKSGTRVAKYRVLRERDTDNVWVQYKLPGKAWEDVKDKGEVTYIDVGSPPYGPLGIGTKGFNTGKSLLKIMGYREDGEFFYGEAAEAL